ncbi:hypothetical protein ACIHFD_64290 [Nonomuraea sp. NPDC051941]|uniref:hypothetical protein n=1 Tax=Nonomuraea sp. NPDC051941 TaxID=3364373 RepID=UPI0037CC58A9
MPSFEHIVQTGRRAGGYIDYANQRNRILQPALVLAQERGLAKHITPHALRHTMITMLRDGGVAPGVMQRALILNAVQPVVTAASRSTLLG